MKKSNWKENFSAPNAVKKNITEFIAKANKNSTDPLFGNNSKKPGIKGLNLKSLLPKNTHQVGSTKNPT